MPRVPVPYLSANYIFKHEHITNKVTTQKVNFYGIVNHVRTSVLKNQSGETNDSKVKSQVDVENIHDKSRVPLFIRHNVKINLDKML